MSAPKPSTSSADATGIPWTVALLFGPLCIAAGAAVLAAAAGYVSVPPSPDPLPAWWLWAGGIFFAAGGAWFLLVRLSRWLAMPFGLVATLTFVWIFNWVAFGPGPRHFSTSTSVNRVVIERSSASEFEGRLVFGIAAALMDLALAYGVLTVLRARFGAGSPSTRSTSLILWGAILLCVPSVSCSRGGGMNPLESWRNETLVEGKMRPFRVLEAPSTLMAGQRVVSAPPKTDLLVSPY